MRSLYDMLGGPADAGEEIIVDLFAGGGGASEGIRMAIGRNPDVAINHNPQAVSMHRANHPDTLHMCEDVWNVPPTFATKGRPVGLLWASPDCTHFSKAKGGAPTRNDKIRSLALVITDKWIPETHPRVIIMENVEEMQTWGPLDAQGRPVKESAGDTWRMFLRRLRRHGYRVEYRELRACDYGAPTIRKRLFLIARRDGLPIVWPVPTHGDPKSEAVKTGQRKPWRTAAECIDWTQPCPSIFETRQEIFERYGVRANRPLAEATQRRIFAGLKRYVLEHPDPFIVDRAAPFVSTFYGERKTGEVRGQDLRAPLRTQTTGNRHALISPLLTECANASAQRNFAANEPLRTQCAQVKGGHFALVAPTLIQTGYGERAGQSPRVPGLDKPLGTAVACGVKHALVSAFLAKHFTGVVGADTRTPVPTITTKDHNAVVMAHIDRQFGESHGNAVKAPLGTTTAGGGGKSALIASSLIKMRGQNIGQPQQEPLRTVSAGGQHHAEVRAFLMKYYGSEAGGQNLKRPMGTATTKDRFGLVTVRGQAYVIADIGMRMLNPRELFRAQGFRDSYIIENGADGEPFSRAAQVRMCGNSVCPPLAAALAQANCAWLAKEHEKEAV
jgi:DNA (cytosine-5)-methyltransferase 1